MQAGDGAFEKTTKKGKAATIARPKPKPKSKRREEVDKEPQWLASLVSCTPLSAMVAQVIFAIVSVVKTITRKKAHRITTQVLKPANHPRLPDPSALSGMWVQVHTMGTATVTVSWKQQAKQYCLKLQEFGLTSSISPEPN
ncbi:MAG: hypothetical protein SGPRY_011707 [Prymnesium sp.]